MRRGIFTIALVSLILLIAASTPNGIVRNTITNAQYNDFSFIAYGDTRGSAGPVSPVHDDLVDAYLQHNPEFILHTGDMVMSGGIWSEWIAFNDSIAAVWDAGVPLFGAVGNHEKYTDQHFVYDEDFSNYTTYFDFSSVIDQPGENELYYSFDHEDVHCIILNTEDYFDEDDHVYTCSTEQLNWLLADLAQTQLNDVIAVAFHRPAWSVLAGRSDRWAQAETVRDDFHSLFVQYGVDLVFCGHDHCYFRATRDGINYITTGGGGAPLYAVDVTAPQFQEGDAAYAEYHYCNIELNSTHYTLSSLTINGTLLDTFTVTKTTITPPPRLPIELILIGVVAVVIIIVVVILVIRWRKV